MFPLLTGGRHVATADEGALVVASHDLPFLAEIGITRWLRLAAGRAPTTAEPETVLADRR